MNSASTASRRPWWIIVAISVSIVGTAASIAQRSAPVHAAAPQPLRTGVIPAMFLKLPDGRFAARTSDLTVELDSGGRVEFNAGLKLSLDGARADAQPEGIDALKATVSFFAGSDPSGWQAGLSTFNGVRYRAVYPGIDMVYRAAGRLKSEFVVAPGGDPSVIRLRFTGSRSVTVLPEGDLRVETGSGELRDEHLEVFQRIAGRRMRIPAQFRVAEPGVVVFDLGEWDRQAELVIDPVISYSSFLGGSRIDQTTGVAVDAAGAAYVSGWTDSPNFPVLSSIRGFSGSIDAFVAKISPEGVLEWASFVGGSGDDRAFSIGVDPLGNSYLAGYTTSTNFPILLPLQANKSGLRDAFVTKIDSTGTAIGYSTYYGGSRNDQANSIAVDAFGQAYVGGDTESPNFPTVLPFQAAFGGLRDAFHFKIGINGTASYSTFAGGTGDDRGIGVQISDSLTPYLVGCTTSKDFPIKAAAQPANAGGQDAFVIRFRQDAEDVVYSSYLGGSGGASGRPECANSIALDAFFNMYVTGVTSSTNFPVVVPVQDKLRGLTDGFLTKLNSDGVILYSTYIGGSASDVAVAVRVDAARRAYVVGYTTSKNLATVNPIQSTAGGNFDIFLQRYEVLGYPMSFGTYFGGQASETPTTLGLTPGGTAYIVGVTASNNYPLVLPFQPNFGGGTDGFITKITGF